MEHGPITAVTLYHSGGGWRDPYIGFHPGGELKGIQPVYGGAATNDLDLLFGAKKPHKPFGFALRPGEVRFAPPAAAAVAVTGGGACVA